MVLRAINAYKLQFPELINDNHKNIAISYYVPLAMYYCFYVKSLIDSPKTPFNKPWFSTRDCNIMREMYDILYPDDNSELFYSSRAVFCKNANVVMKDTIALCVNDYAKYNGKLSELFGHELAQLVGKRVQQEPKKSINKHPTDADKQTAQEILIEIQQTPEYKAFEKSETDKVNQYINHIQLNKPENLIVDLGWLGTIQNGIIGKVPDFQASFVYLYRREINTALINTLSLFTTHQVADGLNHQFSINVESMFSHYTSTLKGVDVIDGELKLHFLDDSDREQKVKQHTKIIEEQTIAFTKWFIQQELFMDISKDIINQGKLNVSNDMQRFLYEMIAKYKVYGDDIYWLVV